jgi:halocyanin-like protein
MNRFSTGRNQAADMSTNEVSRRGFLAATGAAAGSAAAATAAAQESPTPTEGGGNGTEAGGESEGGGNESEDAGNESDGDGGGSGTEVPVFGSYLSDANGYSEEGTQDARGEDEVSVAVGADDGYAFDPATIWVSPGTTIVWEWTGNGGNHNVVAEEGPAGFDSGSPVGDEGATYEYEVTEEDAGITAYKCVPHEGQGMKGGVAVGNDVETTTIETGGGGPAITIPDEALALTVATFFAMTTTLGLGYFFMKYGGDYEQP